MRADRTLVLADLVAMLAFVGVGIASHEEDLTVARVAATAAPLLGAWFSVAASTGLYRRDGLRPLVVTWLVAVPVAAVVRSVLRDGPWDERLVVFAAVALAFTALFVLAGRTVVRALRVRRGQEPSPSAPRGGSSDVTS